MSLTNQTLLVNILLPIQQKIVFGLSWFYVTFGISGCFLNILLFSKKNLRQISCCTYFLVASIVMFIQLIIYSIPSIYAYYYFNPMSMYNIYCKIRMYIILITSLIYRWSYTAATFDRYALSSINQYLRQLAKVKIAYRILFGIIIISMIFSIYVPFVYETKSSICAIFNNPIATLFTSISTIITWAIVPISIMIIFTIFIRKNLAKKRQRQRNLLNYQQEKRDQQAVRMLFVQIIVLIIITIPWLIYSINNVISSYIKNKSSDRIAIENFTTNIGGALAFLFPALSFYLYTLTSSLFRNELYLLLKYFVLCKFLFKNHRIEPTITGNRS